MNRQLERNRTDWPTLVLLTLATLVVPLTATAQTCWFFRAEVLASNLVPPSSSEARGSFESYFVSCNECTLYEEDYLQVWFGGPTGFLGVPTIARIHNGTSSKNGPVLYECDLSQQDISHPVLLQFDVSHCPALRDTLLYVVIATDLHPEGEARGQIIPYAPQPTSTLSWGRIRARFR